MSEASKRPEQDAAPPAADEQLMVAFAKGSTEAFQELFQRYKQPLFGFFRRRVGDRAQAEELTQETFLAVLRAAARYQPTASFRTYLYAIGYKILRGYRRKAAFRTAFFGVGKSEPAARGDDASMLLQLPLNTVRSRLFRARTALRELLTSRAPRRVANDLAELEERA